MTRRPLPDNWHQVYSNQRFYGGQSSDEAIGTDASFSYSRAIDHRRNPSQLTVLPGPRELTKGVITDLILNITQVQSGKRYAAGNTGSIYQIDTNNTVTLFGKMSSGSDGMLYRSDTDTVYLASKSRIYRINPVSTNPALSDPLGPSASTDSNAYRTGGTATYAVPTALDESQLCSFQPDIEPFYSIKVRVVTKGTGDLTLTLHDGLNNVLSTQMITNANLTTGQVEFVFPTPVRGLVKPNARTYHYHLTSTTTGTTVQVATANTLSTADYELWANRLVTPTNGLHPMAQFLQYNCIGNGNYLAVWEPLGDTTVSNAEFQRHRLTFPAGFEVCGLAVTDEFLVIATEKRSSDGTKDFQEGKLFTWDGVSRTYNQIIDVSGGSPYGIKTHENYPYFFVGSTLCAWPGGKNIIKVRTLNNTDSAYRGAIDNTVVYPNMMTIRDGMLHAGYPSVTTNATVEHGVYCWGTLEKNFPASFNYAYVPSSMQASTTGTSLQMGCVQNFGDELYLSWYDGSSYGLDIVDSYCNPAPIAKWRARRFDAGAGYKKKEGCAVVINSAALPDGVTLTPTYRIDDQAEKIVAETAGTTGNDETRASVSAHFKRIVHGFDITVTGNMTPKIYATSLEWDPLYDRRAL